MTEITEWLLDSDPSIVAQVKRDLLHAGAEEQRRAESAMGGSGWARDLLDRRKPDGYWGSGAYNPKWTCTHYVLFELMQLELSRDQRECRESATLLLGHPEGRDGGVNYARTVEYSDACINGMLLSVATYFRCAEEKLRGLVDYLLKIRMDDGGWNCEYYHGAVHSSLHTTIAVLEGLEALDSDGSRYRRNEVREAIAGAVEFTLKHRLYKSERTGEVIKDEFLKYAFPIRWKYDVLRCLDLFRKYGVAYDSRMADALGMVAGAKNANGTWKARSQPGKTYFVMEKNGAEGRWNTLRALRVLDCYASRSD